MTTDSMSGPFFSIVTITLNNLPGLLATKASLDAQSLRDFEWIVVDGNSTDGTKDLLTSLKAVIVSEPDHGLYDAMNKGIARATGRYLLFLNAGDRLADADILTQVKRAGEAFAPDFLYGDALESNGLYKKARDAKHLALGMPTHHQAMLYRRAAVGSLRYDLSYAIAADYDFTARFLKNSASLHYMPCALCIFEDGGVSQRRRALGRAEQYRARRKLGVCHPVTNSLIYAAQTLSAILRETLPRLYFRARRSNLLMKLHDPSI